MSKMSELDLCIGELRSAAQSLTVVADGLTTLFTAGFDSDVEVLPAPREKVSKTKPVTLEQVRAILTEISRGGHTAQVRELLQRHGAKKLSEVDPAEFPSLLQDATEAVFTEGNANE